jgi:hypothetical protein
VLTRPELAPTIPLVVPPETRDEWVRLVTWQLWIGLILFFLVAVGVRLIATPPVRVVVVNNARACDAMMSAPAPCQRTVYRSRLGVVFTDVAGVMMLAVAAWLLRSLWGAAEPAPITDDFLGVLKESFGRRTWRDPKTWPWSRLKWAYGFTTVGVTIGLLLTIALSAAIRSMPSTRPPAATAETVQIFTAQ